MVMASFENKQQVIVRSISQAFTSRPIDIIQITICRGNVVIFHKADISAFVDILSENIFLDAIRPHSPFTVRTNRHIGLELCNTILSVTSINTLFFTFDYQLNSCLSLFLYAFFPDNNICTRLIGANLQSEFHLHLFWAILMFIY